MAHNTKSILVDVNGKPIPQYFDPLADEYKPLLGQHGAARSMLYGPDGNPISDTNKLPVRAADLETLIGALNDSAVTNPANAASVIAALKGLLSVVGKEATLGQILSALAPLATESTLSSLASAVAKETTLAQVLSTLGALATETTLGGVKTAVDTLAGTVADGAQKVTLSGSKVARVATQLPGNTTSGSPSRNVNFINEIAAATTVIIRDTTSPVSIESLYLLHGRAFTFSDLRVHFYLRDSGGNLRFVPVFGSDDPSNDGGFTNQYFSPESLKNAGGKSNLWELVAWNVDNHRQAIWRMLTPITALHGYRLVAENVNQSAAIFVRFQVDIREVLLS